MVINGGNMRKVSVFLLASVMAIPAMANDYGEYDTFGFEEQNA